MIEKIIFLFFAMFLSIFINIAFLNIYKKKIFFVELTIFLIIFLIYTFFFIEIFSSFFEVLYYFTIYISLLGTYTFTMIMGFESSPSLKILEYIKNDRYINKKKILVKFKKNSFFKSRFEDLKKKKYILLKKKKVYLTNKSILLLKIFIFLEKIQGSKNNG